MFAPILLSATLFRLSDAAYFTVWMQGSRIGYSSYSTEPTQFKGKPAEKSTSKTRLNIGLIGSQLEMSVDSDTISVSGRPVMMHFIQSSGGLSKVNIKKRL